jgi:hypothetical protein
MALLAVATAASFVAAPFPREIWLQHSATVLVLVGLRLGLRSVAGDGGQPAL